ncbi:MAG: hypothetical protein JWN54_2414, partial [Mycobacterium sp.]|nr:hypothetical protein [Mycobacterium sp.]
TDEPQAEYGDTAGGMSRQHIGGHPLTQSPERVQHTRYGPP